MQLFKHDNIIGQVVKRSQNGMVDVDFAGTVMTLPESENELLNKKQDMTDKVQEFRKGGYTGTPKEQFDKAVSDLHQAETFQTSAKAINKAIRDNKLTNAEAIVKFLRENNYQDSLIKLVREYADGRFKIPTWQLTNNNSRLKRLKSKVALLQRSMESVKQTEETGEAEEYSFEGGVILLNYDIDRVQILFDTGRVEKDLYKKLRSRGWVYSPTNKAFQRKITADAIRVGIDMFDAKKKLPDLDSEERKTRAKELAAQDAKDVEERIKDIPDSMKSDEKNESSKHIGTVLGNGRIIKDVLAKFSDGRGWKTVLVYEDDKPDHLSNTNTFGHKTYDSENEALTIGADAMIQVLNEIIENRPTVKVPAPYKEYFFTESSSVTRIESGEKTEDFFKKGESIKGLINPDKGDILSTEIVIETESGVEYEVDMNTISLDKSPEPKVEISTRGENFKGIKFEYPNQYILNKAIEELLNENGDSHEDYSTDEKIFIRKYSGYGGLDKYGKTGKGGLFEYYTPPEIIERMWGLAYKYGYNDGSFCEPAIGTGEFLQYMPQKARAVGYDISPYSSKICKILYPTIELHEQPFEQMFIQNNYTVQDRVDHLEKFDLIIGNPPYGSFEYVKSRYMSMGELDHVKAKNYVEYFLRRSIDLLNKDGLLVFIVGSAVQAGGVMFLDSDMTPVKEYLAKHCDLMTAYRLPDSVFERTGVTTDIIVLKKN